jgi:hypothetical protein
MSFETDTLHVVSPLDPYGGDRCNESMDEDAQSLIIENIYTITRRKENYINPITDGELSRRSVKSYDIDYENVMEMWQNKLYKSFHKEMCTYYHRGMRGRI